MKVIRLFGGLILGAGALFFVAIGLLGGIASGNGMGIFAGVFAVGMGIGLGQLSAFCFSPKYANDIAERDYRELVGSSQNQK